MKMNHTIFAELDDEYLLSMAAIGYDDFEAVFTSWVLVLYAKLEWHSALHCHTVTAAIATKTTIAATAAIDHQSFTVGVVSQIFRELICCYQCWCWC